MCRHKNQAVQLEYYTEPKIDPWGTPYSEEVRRIMDAYSLSTSSEVTMHQ